MLAAPSRVCAVHAFSSQALQRGLTTLTAAFLMGVWRCALDWFIDSRDWTAPGWLQGLGQYCQDSVSLYAGSLCYGADHIGPLLP